MEQVQIVSEQARPLDSISMDKLKIDKSELTERSVRNFWYPSLPSVLVTAARMMFLRDVLRLGESPDSRTTTPPSPLVINWSLRRESNRLSDDTLEPTVTNAVGIHPLQLKISG